MAYVFNNIESQLNGQAPQNIFGDSGQPMGQQNQQQQGGQQQQAGGQVQKSSAEADLGPSSGGETAQAKQQPKESDSKILKMNQAVNVADQPIIQKAQQSVGTTQQKIQDESNKLAQSAASDWQAKNIQSFTNDDLRNAIQGGYQLAGVKNALAQGPVDIDKQNINVSTELQNLKALQNADQRQALLMKQGGANMTRGMAGLDERLLRQSPEFRNIMLQLNNSQQGLINQKSAAEADAEARAEATANAAVQAQQADIRNQLGGLKTNIQNEIDANLANLRNKQAQAYQDAINKGVVDSRAGYDAEANRIYAIKKQLEDLAVPLNGQAFNYQDPDYVKYSNQIKNAINSFESQRANNVGGLLAQTFDPNTVTQDQATTAAEAQQFNNIMALLGDSNRIGYNSSPNPTAYNFTVAGPTQADLSAVQNYINQTLAARNRVSSSPNKPEQLGDVLASMGGQVEEGIQNGLESINKWRT